MKDRKDIRVVGDRFVFESEVLFPSGSATLTPEGAGAMDQMAEAILELQKEIPREIDWALQINGHTDARPISSSQFPSNWELSTARAASVVKYLVIARRAAGPPRCRGLRRVPADRSRLERRSLPEEPAHRAEADE